MDDNGGEWVNQLLHLIKILLYIYTINIIMFCCFVARINQCVFRNSSLQMFSCAANDAGREATGGPP